LVSTISPLAFIGRSLFTQPQVFTLMVHLEVLGAALFGIQGGMKIYEQERTVVRFNCKKVI
jgi:hypothetical protein